MAVGKISHLLVLGTFHAQQLQLFLSKSWYGVSFTRYLWKIIHPSSPLLLPVSQLQRGRGVRMEGRSPSEGCCAAAPIVPSGRWSPAWCHLSGDLSAWLLGRATWATDEAESLPGLVVASSRPKQSMRANSVLFFPATTPWAIKPWVTCTVGLLGLKDKKAVLLPFVLHMQTRYTGLRLWVSGIGTPCLFAGSSPVQSHTVCFL